MVPSSNKPVVIDLKDGEKPVCYRNNSIKLNVSSGGIEYAETVYVLGVEGKKILHMSENGEIIK